MHHSEPIRVLLVDISRGYLPKLEPYLQSAGLHTFLAHDFHQLLSDLRRGTFDVILIADSIADIEKNDLPGVIRYINTATYIPIIWIPDKYDSQISIIGLELGVDMVLDPSSPPDLIYAYITKLAKHKRGHDGMLDSIDNLRNMLVKQAQQLSQLKNDNNTLRELSITDPLTGLFNARYMRNWLEQAFAYAKRYNKPISVMLIDMDNLKWINDCYGHLTGDKAIKLIASVLKNSVRDSDLVARYGGDEFLIALPDTPADQLPRLADRILQDLQSSSISSGKEEFTISCSLGSATYPQDGDFAVSEELIDCADQALYAAKRAGRSRLAQWHELPIQHHQAHNSKTPTFVTN